MHKIHWIALLSWIGFIQGCTLETKIEKDDDMSKTLIGSQISDLIRTDNFGDFNGLPTVKNFSNSLQASNLEPGEYTIQFQALPPADGAGFSAYAIINWKVGGQQITRKVSVFSGTSISSVAEAVDVSLVDVSGVGLPGLPATSAPYKIAASLSRGTRPNVQQPATLITQQLALVTNIGSPFVFIVPNDAGVISALVLASRSAGLIIPTDLRVSQITNTGQVVASWYPIQTNNWIALAPGCTGLAVQSFSAADLDVNVIWGIDG